MKTQLRDNIIVFLIWCLVVTLFLLQRQMKKPFMAMQMLYGGKSTYTIEAEESKVLYQDLFEHYFGDDWKIMYKICKAESGMQNIRSHQMNSNGTYDFGLCQINQAHSHLLEEGESLYFPDTNLRIAKHILDSQGLSAWSMYNNGQWFYEEVK